MTWLAVPVAAVLGYLLGSIPVGLLVCKLYGVDIRTVGSGRIGGTNAWRAAGLKAAIPTILGDALKGAVAVVLVRYGLDAFAPNAGETIRSLSVALAGGAAIWGHNWSIFLGFKGGAGGITTAATIMAISPLAGSIVWLTGILVIWWTRIASVGTFTVGVCSLATLVVLAFAGLVSWPLIVFGVMALLGVYISLQTNRERLRNGQERVITIW
jgi:glycerol-3-phosphate acyltransferase PlsY